MVTLASASKTALERQLQAGRISTNGKLIKISFLLGLMWFLPLIPFTSGAWRLIGIYLQAKWKLQWKGFRKKIETIKGGYNTIKLVSE